MKTIMAILSVALGVALASCGKSDSSHAGHDGSAPGAEATEYYTCPMHPQVRSDKPGICPICHMDLVKASNSRQSVSTADAALVMLNERGQILANVSTTVVRYEALEQQIRAFGTLEIPEPGKSVISARFSGRIEKLLVNAAGMRIKRGQPLFEVYSPDLIQASNEYRQAFLGNSDARDDLLTVGKSRLLLLGLTEDQIRRLEAVSSVPLVMSYHSPASGIVMEKRVVEGMYISEGTPLYEVSGIATLWNVADVYESDAARIAVGDRAVLTTPGYPDQKFTATVSFIYPVVNPQSRTVKVRLSVPNAQEKLKPNMYTETVFLRKKGRTLTVPAGAVLVTGKRNLVYVRAGQKNHFEAREVGIGARAGGKYEVTWGLSEGEEVVSEGGYLIDSERQLNSSGSSGLQHGG